MSSLHQPASDVNKYYRRGALLGRGGGGSVYAGIRISDGRPVALKYAEKWFGDRLFLPGEEFPVPREIGLTWLVNQQKGHPNVIRLHEWFDTPKHYVMVLERPDPCLDLDKWILMSENHALAEDQARAVMEQLLQALIHCQKHGVFHRDVKPGNILINTATLRVILIDFGCGDLWKDTPFYMFSGTDMFKAPEWYYDQVYSAGPATVWSVGVTLYGIVCGCLPFQTIEDVCMRSFTFPGTLSSEIRDFINQCLALEEENRPTLQELLLHPWLHPVSLETVSERRGVQSKRGREEEDEQALMHSEYLRLSSTSARPAECSQQGSERRGVQSKRGREEDEGQVLMHSEYLRLSSTSARPAEGSQQGSNEGRLHEGLQLPLSLFPGAEEDHTGDQLQQYGPQERRGRDEDEEQVLMHSEYLGLSSTRTRPAECSRQGPEQSSDQVLCCRPTKPKQRHYYSQD